MPSLVAVFRRCNSTDPFRPSRRCILRLWTGDDWRSACSRNRGRQLDRVYADHAVGNKLNHATNNPAMDSSYSLHPIAKVENDGHSRAADLA